MTHRISQVLFCHTHILPTVEKKEEKHNHFHTHTHQYGIVYKENTLTEREKCAKGNS